MSPINKLLIAGLLLISGLVMIVGCGSSTPNAKAPYDADSAKHPDGWLPEGHMIAARADQNVCAECHGSDYLGGISGVSCSSCHLGGSTSVHPTSWGTGTQVELNHAAYVNANGVGACSNVYCHGTDLNGNAGPACTSCHVNGSPLTATGCTSCHGKPPTGTVSPNRAGAHNSIDGHFAAQVTLPDGCNTCHNGAGSGTTNHNNGADHVLFLSIYSAKSGTAVFNADGTCSNVSCHGGLTTPAWETGKIDVNTQCTSCHTFNTAEYNSFKSGQHYTHVFLKNLSCNFCHDVSKLVVNHFTSLNTQTLEVPAASTIQDYVNYNSAAATCTPGCHVTRVW